MNFIKELYFGNISSGEQAVVQGSEFDKLGKTCDMLFEELKKEMSEENVEKFKCLDSLYGDIIDLTAEENYSFGFRDGARLMLDILTGKNENFRYLIE